MLKIHKLKSGLNLIVRVNVVLNRTVEMTPGFKPFTIDNPFSGTSVKVTACQYCQYYNNQEND